jgi:hypothetical protein
MSTELRNSIHDNKNSRHNYKLRQVEKYKQSRRWKYISNKLLLKSRYHHKCHFYFLNKHARYIIKNELGLGMEQDIIGWNVQFYNI